MIFKHKFVFILSLVFLPLTLTAQNIQQLHQLYAERKLDVLKAEVAKTGKQYAANPHIVFFKTLFNEDGDAAAKVYEQLVVDAQGTLKNCLITKLSEYYYARGFYIKARNWKSQLVPDQQEVTNTVARNPYKIQVGAFSFQDNAMRVKSFLGSHQIAADVVKRSLGGKDLYCVWIDGGETREETERIAQGIVSKFDLTYRIIQP
jgi:hypothetical protein